MLRRQRVKARAVARTRVAWLPLAAAAALAGLLFHLRLVQQCRRLAGEMAAAERRLEQLRQVRVNEECRWAPMTTLASVRAALKRFGIEMDWAGGERTVYLVRPASPLGGEAVRGPRLAQRVAGRE